MQLSGSRYVLALDSLSLEQGKKKKKEKRGEKKGGGGSGSGWGLESMVGLSEGKGRWLLPLGIK